jgi:hypothetical protein
MMGVSCSTGVKKKKLPTFFKSKSGSDTDMTCALVKTSSLLQLPVNLFGFICGSFSLGHTVGPRRCA